MRRSTGALAAGLLALGLTACGGGGSSSGATASPSQPALQSLMAQPPTQILDTALGNMAKEPYLKYSFSGTDRYGPTSFTVISDNKGDLSGTLTTRGQTGAIVLYHGIFYVQGPALTNILTLVPPVPTTLPSTAWIELHQTGGNGFFDALAQPRLLQACIHASGENNVIAATPTQHGAQQIVQITNPLSSSSAVPQTAGTYTVLASSTPIITSWTITSVMGSQDEACPGGPETGASANLLNGTLSISVPKTAPTIAAPPVTYNEPQDDQYTYLPTPQG